MPLQSCWQAGRKKEGVGGGGCWRRKQKGHCGFLWPPLLVNKLGRVKLDKRKKGQYKQCDHLEQRKEGGIASGEQQLPLNAGPCGSDSEVRRRGRGGERIERELNGGISLLRMGGGS